MQPITQRLPSQALDELKEDATKKGTPHRRKGVSFADLSRKGTSCSQKIQDNAKTAATDASALVRNSLEQRACFAQARQSLDQGWNEINNELFTDTFFPAPTQPSASQIKTCSQLLTSNAAKKDMQRRMKVANALSIVPRAIDKGIQAAVHGLCTSSQPAQNICQGIRTVGQAMKEQIPISWRKSVSNAIERIHLEVPQHFERIYGIPRDETSYFLQSTGFLAKYAIPSAIAVKVAQKGVTAANSTLKKMRASHVLDTTNHFIPSVYTAETLGTKCFIFKQGGQETGFLKFYHVESKNRSLLVYVESLRATQEKTHNVARTAMKSLMSFAREKNARELLLSFEVDNLKLFAIAEKRFTSLGIQRPFTFKNRLGGFIQAQPVFKVDLK
jgi:hypothetical protein